MELKEFLEGIVMIQELYPDFLSRPSIEELQLRCNHELTILNLKTQMLREQQELERQKVQLDLALKQKLFEQVSKEMINDDQLSAIKRIAKLKQTLKEGNTDVK